MKTNSKGLTLKDQVVSDAHTRHRREFDPMRAAARAWNESIPRRIEAMKAIAISRTMARARFVDFDRLANDEDFFRRCWYGRRRDD